MQLSDQSATLQQIKEIVRVYCTDRDWDQFHNAKDLSIGLSVEAAELLEIFRFKSEDEVTALLKTSQKQHIEEELADCLFFLARFADRFGIDMASAFAKKMQKNAEKYPIAKAKGKNLKYDQL